MWFGSLLPILHHPSLPQCRALAVGCQGPEIRRATVWKDPSAAHGVLERIRLSIEAEGGWGWRDNHPRGPVDQMCDQAGSK